MSVINIAGSGQGLPIPGSSSNQLSDYVHLAAGAKYLIPAGTYQLILGPYTVFQINDPIQGWTTQALASDGQVYSDGVNFRIANLTGCVVGAIVTTAGSGYLTAPTVTPSAGGSTWKAIIGGMLSTTVTVAAGGAGYVHPPAILLPPPPAGGIQATATATVSGGAITAVTMTGVGAGYTVAPIAAPASTGNATLNTFGPYPNAYQIVPDPADTITTTASLTFSLQTGVAASSISAIVNVDPGNPVTSVPTFTISAAPSGGTTAVATAIPLFTVTGVTLGAAGSNYGNAQPITLLAPGTLVSGTAANAQSMLNTGLFQTRAFQGYSTSTAGGLLTTTSVIISDGGFHQAVPTIAVIASGNTIPTAAGQFTASVGGVSDVSILIRR